MQKQVYLVACAFLCFNAANATMMKITPKYMDNIIRAYRALGEEEMNNKVKTICALNDKFQTALKSLGDRKAVMIPLDSQANVFLALDAAEATEFGQKFQEVYATEIKTCLKSDLPS